MNFDFRVLVEQSLDIWRAGGWGMIALAINAFILFALGIRLWLRIRGRHRRVPERTWRRWIENPSERRGPVGEVIDFVGNAKGLDDLAARFAELRSTEIAPFNRDLKLLKRAISTAPLLGLLGTVTGMLTTFHALASGAGGDKTMEAIARGISEALITTETGLVIALPGLFFQHQLARRFETYRAFLAHLESVCAQALYRRMGQRRKGSAARSARTELARRIVERLRAGAARGVEPPAPGHPSRALTAAGEH